MKINVREFQELGETGLKFECFGGWDDFETISNILENEIDAVRIEKIDGVYTRVCWYKKEDLIFGLHHHEDIGNFISMTDVEEIKYLNKIRKNKDALNILDQSSSINDDSTYQRLYKLSLEVTNALNKEIPPPGKEYTIDQYISLEKRGEYTIILLDGKCTEIELLSRDKKEFTALCSEIEEWVKSSYAIGLKPDYLEWQILQGLIELDAPNSKKAFKNHVAERYKNATPSYSEWLKEHGYLDDFTKEELDELKNKNSKK